MPMDYEVFEPNDEHLAQIIVRILEERGYNAGYQLGYPNNKVFIKVDAKEEADRISGIIRRFMEKFSLTERGITTDKLNTSISKLSSLIPETPGENEKKLAENIEKKIETKTMVTSKFQKARFTIMPSLKNGEAKSLKGLIS